MNFEKFTEKSLGALRGAQNSAVENRNSEIELSHFLLSLLADGGGLISELLCGMGVDVGSLTRETEGIVKSLPRLSGGGYSPERVYLSAAGERLLSDAEKNMKDMGDEFISVEHIMLAFFSAKDDKISKLFEKYGIRKKEFLEALKKVRGNMRVTNENPEETYNVLEKYGQDLVVLAREHKLDPVIGRDDEIRNVIRILSRKSKNNPCLIGEPGVGKTAVVEGLAQRITAGDIPEVLKGKRVFALDLSSMVAGAKYRGEFEDRLKKAMEEVTASGNVILFIDEMHTIVGAGAAEGAIDASNILKPSLARGEMQVIGATTISEYRKYIEKDAALERRFQPVTVEEPSTEETVEILKGIRDKYEAHHSVKISDEAIKAAVKLSQRYITDRFLPDKAIDLIDEASSKTRLTTLTAPPQIKEFEEKIENIKNEKEEAVKNQEFEKAAALRDSEKEIRAKLEEMKEEWQKDRAMTKSEIGEEDIAAIVSSWTGIPANRLCQEEGERLLKLEATLHERVIGQHEAVSAVSKAIRRGRVGLRDEKRPIGSFIFLGPTGVGKTELSKAIASALFGDDDAMIRIDMSEYMEKHSVSRLVGSPPGYVGFDEGGQLTEKVRRKPYSVLLFDEIEKAHPDVFNILLQILDDGILTDSQGRRVDFRNTIIIMTSNVGAREITNQKHLGFGESSASVENEKIRDNVMSELKRVFRPEFLNRIDDIIVFERLSEENTKEIAKLMLKSLTERLAGNNITATFDDSALCEIAKEGFDPVYGARPLRRAISSKIEDMLAEEILEGKISENDTVTVMFEEDKWKVVKQ